MIHLCFSDSAGGTLRYYSDIFRITDKIYTLSLHLHIGDISNPFFIKNRRQFYNVVTKGYANDVAAEIKQFKKGIACNKKICIWYCNGCTDEYLGFLFIVDYLRDRGYEIYSADCGNVFSAIGAATDEEINSCVIPTPALLSSEDVLTVSGKWQNIARKNTFLRIVKNEDVLSLGEDSYDRIIFDIAGKEPIRVSVICDEMLCNHTPFLLIFVLYRIESLIREGEFRVVEKGYRDKYLYGYVTDFMKYVIQKT